MRATLRAVLGTLLRPHSEQNTSRMCCFSMNMPFAFGWRCCYASKSHKPLSTSKAPACTCQVQARFPSVCVAAYLADFTFIPACVPFSLPRRCCIFGVAVSLPARPPHPHPLQATWWA